MARIKNEEKAEEKTSVNHKILTVVGVLLCVILIPILVINVTLIIKSYAHADEVPKIGGYCPLIVLTGSMEPQIMEGDLIIVKQIDGADVSVGDVIAFFDPDGNGTSILTHRVVEVLEEDGVRSFRTMGDANNGAADRLPVSETKLVGIWNGARIPGAGNVAMFMQTPAGLVICVGVPLILIIGWDILRRRRYEKRNREDTDALLEELAALRAAKAAEAAGAPEAPAPEIAPEPTDDPPAEG